MRALVIIALCWGTMSQAQDAEELSMVDWIERGKGYAEKGMLVQAVLAYEEAVKLGAGSPQVLNPLAELYLAAGKIDQAEVALKRSLTEKPAQLSVYSRLGEVYLASGKLDSAIAYVEAARQLSPSTSVIYSSLGFLHLQKGDLVQSRSLLQKAIELDPKNPEALRFLGFYYTQIDSLDTAIGYYQKMTAIVPDDVEAWNNMAFLYSQQRQYAEALEYYAKAKSFSTDARLNHAINMNVDAIRAVMDEKMRARYILVESEVEARSVLKRLEQGADFGDLAAQFSKAPNAGDGGDVGFFGSGDLNPAFEEAVLQLEVGKVSPPIKVQSSFMLIQRLN
jgi:tetratricopeptide (TPR) repeat protein